MCGIAGVVGDHGDTEASVWHQLETLTHRGPDATGVFAGHGGAIGQTRLSVIDLVTGDPPITNEDGSIGVALNGEIYNYRQLADSLRRQGHDLKTTGDTEVLAHLAEERSPTELACDLDGMFAFAVWDRGRRRLILGRDRLGKKPLYYWSGDGHIVFASEIKGLLAHPRVPRRLNVGILPDYLAMGYAPTPDTFFQDIHSVPPGHVLVAEEDQAPRLQRYWEPPMAGESGLSILDCTMAEAARRVRAELTGAVERRLVADVPLGAFLSGGIDSSAVVALMHRAGVAPLYTFTIGFEDQTGFDERQYANLVAKRFGTDHTELVVRPNATELMEDLVWHHDQPFGDSSALPTYLLSQMTREHVTVALSGDGGDEVFAGYERFAAAGLLGWLQQLPGPVRRGLFRGTAVLSPSWFSGRARSLQRLVANSDRSFAATYLSWISYVPEQWRVALLGEHAKNTASRFEAQWPLTPGPSLLHRLLQLNLTSYLLDDLLPKVDRMSMAHGLEVRCPFLDPAVLELATRLPASLKQRGFALKRVLKVAMADLLPAEILHRRKRGFGVPLDRWFREDLAGYVAATLGSPDASVRQYLVGDAVDDLIAEHQSGRVGHGNALWTLLTLEIFLRKEGW